jgi:hypothetical protein
MAQLTLVSSFTKVLLGRSSLDLSASATNVRVGLTTVAPVIANTVYGDITGELATGGGYYNCTTDNASSKLLASKELINPGSGGVWALDAADVSWTFSSAVTFRYAFLYLDHTVSGFTGLSSFTKPLIGFFDTGASITINGTAWSITWNVNGIFTVGS